MGYLCDAASKNNGGSYPFPYQSLFKSREQPGLADPCFPESNTTRPSPELDCRHRCASKFNSSSRPINGVTAPE